MEIVKLKDLSPIYEKDILAILMECDKEFVPRLSTRDSVVTTNFSSKKPFFKSRAHALKDYFNELKEQNFLLLVDSGRVVGLLAYKLNYFSEIIPDSCNNVYISLVIMRSEYRRRGLSRSLLESLFNYYPDRPVFIRTWSTNNPQISMLRGLLFTIVERIPNDRRKGVDTVYFRRSPNNFFA